MKWFASKHVEWLLSVLRLLEHLVLDLQTEVYIPNITVTFRCLQHFMSV